uniref:Uncharacterized protein n=1 Tax=Cannabis sativa TaxID=3483 RepID=A0A803Q7Z0_CANSA
MIKTIFHLKTHQHIDNSLVNFCISPYQDQTSHLQSTILASSCLLLAPLICKLSNISFDTSKANLAKHYSIVLSLLSTFEDSQTQIELLVPQPDDPQLVFAFF